MSDPQEAATPQHIRHVDVHGPREFFVNGPWFCCVTVQLGGIGMDDCDVCGRPWPCAEAATPSDPHSAEARAKYPDDYNGWSPQGIVIPSLREGFDAGRVSRDAEVAELKAKIADAWDEGLSAGCDRWADSREFGDPPINPYRSASSPVEGGN